VVTGREVNRERVAGRKVYQPELITVRVRVGTAHECLAERQLLGAGDDPAPRRLGEGRALDGRIQLVATAGAVALAHLQDPCTSPV